MHSSVLFKYKYVTRNIQRMIDDSVRIINILKYSLGHISLFHFPDPRNSLSNTEYRWKCLFSTPQIIAINELNHGLNAILFFIIHKYTHTHTPKPSKERSNRRVIWVFSDFFFLLSRFAYTHITYQKRAYKNVAKWIVMLLYHINFGGREPGDIRQFCTCLKSKIMR